MFKTIEADNEKARKFAEALRDALQGMLDNKISPHHFIDKLAEAIEEHDGVPYNVVALASIRELTDMATFLAKHGLPVLAKHGLPALAGASTQPKLEEFLQYVSNACYNAPIDQLPKWNAVHYGDKLIITQHVHNAPLMVAILERGKEKPITVQDHIDKIKARIVELYEHRANQSDVVNDIAAVVARVTNSPWKATSLKHYEFNTQSGRLFVNTPEDEPYLIKAWDAKVPSADLMSSIASAIGSALQPYYGIAVKTRYSGWFGDAGEARCLMLKFCTAPEVGGTDLVQFNMILSLDDVESKQDFQNSRYASLLPDCGDRSRNEPVYLMSAKATRSLLDGAPLDRSLDDIRRVAKQQGWSDVQAFGQQLLFIS